MPFYRRPDGSCTPIAHVGDGSVKIPNRKWPPGYVDPVEVIQKRDYYLAKWKNEGKVITQIRQALALALARHSYYSPTMPRNQCNPRGTWKRHWWKNLPEEEKERLREIRRKALAAGRLSQKLRREARARNAAIEAGGKTVRRQFVTNQEGI